MFLLFLSHLQALYVQILEALKMTQKEPKHVALKIAFYVTKLSFFTDTL